jgi:hypothetical protein
MSEQCCGQPELVVSRTVLSSGQVHIQTNCLSCGTGWGALEGALAEPVITTTDEAEAEAEAEEE